jgi:hypothetical protein
MADEPPRFRVPPEPEIVTDVIQPIITDHMKVRVMVDPSAGEVKRYQKPKLPPFSEIETLRKLYSSAVDYQNTLGETRCWATDFVVFLREALKFADELEGNPNDGHVDRAA